MTHEILKIIQLVFLWKGTLMMIIFGNISILLDIKYVNYLDK